VARELGRLHDLTRDWPQRPAFKSTRELLRKDTGGDALLDLMPAEAVARMRAAWGALSGEPISVVQGDPQAGNIRIEGGRAGFLDWDEARVDASVLDLADLPLDMAASLGAERLERARRAADAWEAASSWLMEPEYARRRLGRLYGEGGAH
jgi:Ser/Thr protein kinase RdoA (MazF antagonist)